MKSCFVGKRWVASLASFFHKKHRYRAQISPSISCSFDLIWTALMCCLAPLNRPGGTFLNQVIAYSRSTVLLWEAIVTKARFLQRPISSATVFEVSCPDF